MILKFIAKEILMTLIWKIFWSWYRDYYRYCSEDIKKKFKLK